MGNLTNINDRLTPSVPIEITFGAQPVATGRKYTTLFGHRAVTGGTALDYTVYTVTNVGDPVAAQAEVDALAGVGSQISAMTYAFVNANSSVSEARNFPAFRIVILPHGELHFGPNGEAINAVKFLRTDMFVSCYPTGDATNRNTLLALAQLISGIDRDLQGQFGSFISLGSIEALTTQELYAINNKQIISHSLPDTNTAAVTGVTATTTTGSNILTAVSSVAGIYEGATISGIGIPSGATVETINATTITISASATATGTLIALTIQNVVSQQPEIVAAACAAVMMQSAFPYNPLQGVVVGGLVPPRILADRIDINPSGASEAALVAGLSPLYTQAGGTVAFIRTRTTYNLLADNVTTVTAYFDWQDLVLLYDFREDVYGITQNPPFNNNPGGSKASKALADLLKDEILREAQSYEDLNAFQGVKTNAPLFLVQPSSTSRGRFDFKVPVNVIPGLMVIAGNIEAVSGANFGDFTL